MSILVVDDDPMSRKMLNFLLQGEGFEVLMAESIRAAQAILAKDAPWLILLDVGLPDGDGLTFCRKLAQDEPDIPVIMLTSRGLPEDKISGLRHGADDYVVKPYDHSELVERIKAVLRRNRRAQPHLLKERLQVGDLELSISELKVKKTGRKPVDLTPTEMKILTCLMSNAGKVLNRSNIAESALGVDYGGESNVVDVYVRRLRKKIENDPARPRYIETVVGGGYRMCKPEAIKV